MLWHVFANIAFSGSSFDPDFIWISDFICLLFIKNLVNSKLLFKKWNFVFILSFLALMFRNQKSNSWLVLILKFADLSPEIEDVIFQKNYPFIVFLFFIPQFHNFVLLVWQDFFQVLNSNLKLMERLFISHKVKFSVLLILLIFQKVQNLACLRRNFLQDVNWQRRLGSELCNWTGRDNVPGLAVLGFWEVLDLHIIVNSSLLNWLFINTLFSAKKYYSSDVKLAKYYYCIMKKRIAKQNTLEQI